MPSTFETGEDYWPHAPVHRLSQTGTYFVTARTYKEHHYFKGAARLSVLYRGLLKCANMYGWQMEAWAVFSNHYHFVAHSPANAASAESMVTMLTRLHSETAKWVNKLDNTPGRQVWHNYRETALTYPQSYLARLNYTHQNPVKHGLVATASQYPWGSASWFERTATLAQVRQIYKIKTDQVKVEEVHEVHSDW
jgi:putative transposase